MNINNENTRSKWENEPSMRDSIYSLKCIKFLIILSTLGKYVTFKILQLYDKLYDPTLTLTRI